MKQQQSHSGIAPASLTINNLRFRDIWSVDLETNRIQDILNPTTSHPWTQEQIKSGWLEPRATSDGYFRQGRTMVHYSHLTDEWPKIVKAVPTYLIAEAFSRQ